MKALGKHPLQLLHNAANCIGGGGLGAVKSILCALVLACFFSFPGYRMGQEATFAQQAELQTRWVSYWGQVVHLKAENPLLDYTKFFGNDTNIAKRNLRILTTTLAFLTQSGVAGAFTINLLAGLIVLWISSVLGRRHFDEVGAFLMVLFLASTYIGTSGIKDIMGWFDATGYACLALALVVRQPILVGLALLLGSFSDDRVILASLWVLFYHLVDEKADALRPRYLMSNAFVWAVFGAIAAHIVLRLGIIRLLDYGLSTGGIGGEVIDSNIKRLPLSLWAGFEGGWLLVIGGGLLLVRNGQRVYGALIILAILPSVALCHLVLDTTRSMGYLFPVFFVVAKAMQLTPALKVRTRENLLLATAVISLVMPNLFVWHQIHHEASVIVYLMRNEMLHLYVMEHLGL